MDSRRIEQQMRFLAEIDQMKAVYRQTLLIDRSRTETDAEHSWHMALMACLLSEYANEEVDLLHVLQMILVHDLVEIDAGDTYAYDDAGNATKREREEKAADRIFSILPEDQAKKMRDLWEEFEAEKTPESLFAHVMDNFQPLALNDANDGGDWKRRNVKKSQILKRNARTKEGSEEIWKCMEEIIDRNVKKGNIIDE